MGPLRGGYAAGPKRPVSKDTLRRVTRTFRPYRAQVIWTALAVLGSAGLGVASPFFLQIIISHGLLAHSLAVVTRYTLLTLLFTIGGTALALGYSYLSIVIGQHIMRDLRNELFDHLQGMSLRFFTGTRTGEIQSRLANDVNNVQSVVSDTAASVLSNVTTVLSNLVAMIYMDLPHFHRQEDKGNRVLRLLLIRSFRLYVKGQRDYSIPWS